MIARATVDRGFAAQVDRAPDHLRAEYEEAQAPAALEVSEKIRHIRQQDVRAPTGWESNVGLVEFGREIGVGGNRRARLR